MPLYLLVALAIVLLVGALVVAAVDNDGRINVVHHLGGDVVYCVDAERNVASSYAGGGLLLVNSDGQHLFFVPEADINAVPEFPDMNTLIAEGMGSYGPVSLWRLTNGRFELHGLDEHDKPYLFDWSGCAAVGEVRPTPTAKPEACGDSDDTPSRRGYDPYSGYGSYRSSHNDYGDGSSGARGCAPSLSSF